MSLAHDSRFARWAVLLLVLAVALVMLVACQGDMAGLMPVAMACAIVLTATLVALPQLRAASLARVRFLVPLPRPPTVAAWFLPPRPPRHILLGVLQT